VLEVIDSKYRILRTIGKGGCGTVFVAWHESLQREVALKVLTEANPSAIDIQRFRQEAQSLTACKHPSIVQIHAFGRTEDNRLYYVMDYIGGNSLAADIKENGPLKPERFEKIFEQILSALDHAHSAGLVHRDIKPSNIMLTTNGGTEQAVLIDFGLTRAVERSVKLTATDSLIGTPYYMSPEQCTGGAKIDQRSDIYSLGCTMLEAATGKLPFEGEAFEVLFAQISQTPDTIPTELLPFMEGCLAKDPDKRFPNARAALSALKSLGLERYKQFSTGKLSLQQNAAKATLKRASNKAPIRIAMFLLVLIAGGFGWFIYAQQQIAPREVTPVTRRPADEQSLFDAQHASLDTLKVTRLPVWENEPDLRLRIQLLSLVGDRQAEEKKWPDAMKSYTVVLKSADELPDYRPEDWADIAERYISAAINNETPYENWQSISQKAIDGARRREAYAAERKLLVQRALVLARLDDRKGAERDLQRAVKCAELAPDLPEDRPQIAYFYYANCCDAWHEPDKGLPLLAKGIDLFLKREEIHPVSEKFDPTFMVTSVLTKKNLNKIQPTTLRLTSWLVARAQSQATTEPRVELLIKAAWVAGKSGATDEARRILITAEKEASRSNEILQAHVLHAYLNVVPMSKQEVTGKMLKALRLCTDSKAPGKEGSYLTALVHVSSSFRLFENWEKAFAYMNDASLFAANVAHQSEGHEPWNATWYWYEKSITQDVAAAFYAQKLGDKTKEQLCIGRCKKLMQTLSAKPQLTQENRDRIAAVQQLLINESKGIEPN
jgi:serine/threonine protein kinase